MRTVNTSLYIEPAATLHAAANKGIYLRHMQSMQRAHLPQTMKNEWGKVFTFHVVTVWHNKDCNVM